MKLDCLDGYFQQIDRLNRDLQTVSIPCTDFVEIIASHKDKYEINTPEHFFLLGEEAFYCQQYEASISHYLKAKTIPNFEFYCYRASAYAAKMKGLINKARSFADKAKSMVPTDPYVNSLDCQPSIDKESTNEHGSFSQNMEQNMNTDASVFSYPRSFTPEVTTELTERLYLPQEVEEKFTALIDPPHSKQWELSFDESTYPIEPTYAFHSFQKSQNDLLKNYLKQRSLNPLTKDHCFYFLHGWNFKEEHENPCITVPFLLTENLRKTTGGYFLRWNGKGIVINPGKNFLDNFHRAGLHIQDIDYVIVTSSKPENYCDTSQIYDLNYHLNRLGQDLQVIHYYLNPIAHQELAHVIKPNFKQERNTIQNLELFVDSPDIEKIELGSGIVLHYFPTSVSEFKFLGESSLGIKIELHSSEDKVSKPLNFGYVSQTAWNPLLGHRLGHCDVLIAGFGNTSSNDFSRIAYNQDCLGYHGVFSLFEEIAPKILLCAEFDGREGDIRLDIVKKMRQDSAQSKFRSSQQSPALFPGDVGLFLDLQTLRIQCSLTENLFEPSELHVVRSNTAFGTLKYLSPSCYL